MYPSLGFKVYRWTTNVFAKRYMKMNNLGMLVQKEYQKNSIQGMEELNLYLRGPPLIIIFALDPKNLDLDAA